MKVVLVTGGTTGIGRACCATFINLGYKVVINYIENDLEARTFLNELNKPSHCMLFKADVTIQSEVLKMKKAISLKFGNVSILVNNAGSYPRIEFNKIKINFWNQMIHTNLTSQFICSKIFSEGMITNKSGSIINIGSILSKVGRKELLPYIVAKAGVEGLTKSLAIELGEFNIRCNCILPGSIKVDKERSLITDPAETEVRQLKKQCIKRRGLPEDVSNLVAFLASDQSSFITGQSIAIDGGWFFNQK